MRKNSLIIDRFKMCIIPSWDEFGWELYINVAFDDITWDDDYYIN
jgi:hypothetical protein